MKGNKQEGKKIRILTVICVFFALFLVWVDRTWPLLTMDQLVHHIKAGFSGLEGTPISIFLSAIPLCVLPTVLLGAAHKALIGKIGKKRVRSIVRGVLAVASLAAFLGMALYMGGKLKIVSFFKYRLTDSGFVEYYYTDPADVKLTFPEKKRNLIYIFLESMETTFAGTQNGGAFEDNLIPELTQLAKEGEDFSGSDDKLNGAYMMPYTSWTMAGIFAQTAGLPLNIPIKENAMSTQEHFFESITTLGDILEEQGYNQVFLCGSDANFGGRALYFREHGGYVLDDLMMAREEGRVPEDYYVWWGYEDEKLFEYAKENLLELAEKGEPFNFAMLTADTHFEHGYKCRLCGDEYDEQYSNVYRCSSRQVAAFIEWIKQQSFYENTTVVLMGDHLTMDGKYISKMVPDDFEQKIYTAFLNAAVTPEDPTMARRYSSFDSLPTTLAAMGVEIEGNKLGLGTNLFSTEATLNELFTLSKYEKLLYEKSKFLDELGEIDLTLVPGQQ